MEGIGRHSLRPADHKTISDDAYFGQLNR